MNSLKTKSIKLWWCCSFFLTCEKFTNVRNIAFSCFLCSSPCACDCNAFSTICIDVLITWPTVLLQYVYCLFPLLKDIVLATVCYKHTFPLCRNKFRLKKNKHTHTIEQHVWLLELTFFSDKSCQNRQIPVCKGDNPNIKYETFEPMCIRTLFSSQAHSTSLIMAFLHSYSCSKLADFFSKTLFLILREI